MIDVCHGKILLKEFVDPHPFMEIIAKPDKSFLSEASYHTSYNKSAGQTSVYIAMRATV